MKLTHTRGYARLARRQERHHHLRAIAVTPRDQVAEALRHLRAVADLVNLDDPASAGRVALIIETATAEVSGLYLDALERNMADRS